MAAPSELRAGQTSKRTETTHLPRLLARLAAHQAAHEASNESASALGLIIATATRVVMLHRRRGLLVTIPLSSIRALLLLMLLVTLIVMALPTRILWRSTTTTIPGPWLWLGR